MKLTSLSDLKTWTTGKSVVQLELIVQQSIQCILEIMTDLIRVGDTQDEVYEFFKDVYTLLGTMNLYYYDEEEAAVFSVAFPREGMGRTARTFDNNVDLTQAVQVPDDYVESLLDDLNGEFKHMRMSQVTRSVMRWADASYLFHRGNLETIFWYSLINRLIRKNIYRFGDSDPGTVTMLASIAKTIQGVIFNHFPIPDHHVPGKEGKDALMILLQSVCMEEKSALEETMFMILDNPIPRQNRLVPYLDICAVKYYFTPKGTSI